LHSCRPSISLQMRSSFVTLIFDRLFSHVCSKQPSTHGMDLCNRSGRERHSSRDLSSRVYFKCRLMAVAGLDQPAGTAAPDRSCLCSCLPWPASSGLWPVASGQPVVTLPIQCTRTTRAVATRHAGPYLSLVSTRFYYDLNRSVSTLFCMNEWIKLGRWLMAKHASCMSTGQHVTCPAYIYFPFLERH
jgi:hypothetical protein